MKTNMKLATVWIVALLSLFVVADATAVLYTYESADVPKAVPDVGKIVSTLDVPDSFEIADVDVVVNISHSQNSDLDVYLKAPNGTTVELFTDVGFYTKNFTNTLLDDEADTSIKNGSAPFTGSYQPEGSLATLDGSDAQGTWQLVVIDDRGKNTGTLNSWGLSIDSAEPPPPPPPPPESGGILYESKDVPMEIKDPGTIASALEIADAYIIVDVNVALSIVHPYDEDLTATLIAPDGTSVTLFTNIGGGGADFKDTMLNDECNTAIADGSAPFMGIYQPEGSLSDFDGLNAKGTWLLEISDDSKLDVGTLICWSLTIDYVPVAKCQDVTVPAQKNRQAVVELFEIASCDSSFDPDGDEITVTLEPEGPYAIGETEVTITVTDENNATASCTATVTVTPTTYSLREEAVALLADLVNPDDPNDPIQLAVDHINASLANGVFWASPERIADAQRGEGGAEAFEQELAACELLVTFDPNDPNVAETMAEAVELLVTADKAVTDAIISAAAFQGGDVAEAKALRCQACVARSEGDICTTIAKYAEAWQAAADQLWVPPVEIEIEEVPTPTLDYDQDGDVDIDDLWLFTEDILGVLMP
jgi:subtilisin-like proprotein convertase family protein